MTPLSIGELTGTIGLETSAFHDSLDRIGGLLEGNQGKWAGIVGAAGLAVVVTAQTPTAPPWVSLLTLTLLAVQTLATVAAVVVEVWK